jgi:hypothetical protein
MVIFAARGSWLLFCVEGEKKIVGNDYQVRIYVAGDRLCLFQRPVPRDTEEK